MYGVADRMTQCSTSLKTGCALTYPATAARCHLRPLQTSSTGPVHDTNSPACRSALAEPCGVLPSDEMLRLIPKTDGLAWKCSKIAKTCSCFAPFPPCECYPTCSKLALIPPFISPLSPSLPPPALFAPPPPHPLSLSLSYGNHSYGSYGAMRIRPNSTVVGKLCHGALYMVPKMSVREIRQFLYGLEVLNIRMKAKLFRCVHRRLDEMVRLCICLCHQTAYLVSASVSASEL